jgi:hypothetical protein
MAINLTTIKNLVMRFTTTGQQQATQAVRTMAQAQQNLANILMQTKNQLNATNNGILSSSAAFTRLQARLDPAIAAMNEYNRSIRIITAQETLLGKTTTETARARDLANKRLQEATAAHNNLDRSARQSAARLANMNAQFQDIAVSLQAGQSPFTVFLQQGSQLSQIFSARVVGITAAILAIPIALATVTTAYAKFETRVIALNNALRATGNISGQTGEGLERSARALARSGTFSLTDIRESQKELIRFREIAGETFNEVLRLAKDVASGGMVDLKEAVIAIAKAMSDLENSESHLEKANIRLSVSDRRAAIELRNRGEIIKAQRVILDAIGKDTSGSDAKAADSLGAAWQRLWTAGGGLLERWGKIAAEAIKLRQIMEGLAGVYERLAMAMDQSKGASAGNITTNIGNLAKAASNKVLGTNFDLTRNKPAPDLGDTFADRFSASTGGNAAGGQMLEIEKQALAVRANKLRQRHEEAAAEEAVQRAYKKTMDVLQEETKLSGKSAAEIEKIKKAREATVEGRKEEADIQSEINRRLAGDETRQVTDQLKTQADAYRAEGEAVRMNNGAAQAHIAVQNALSNAKAKNITLSEEQTAAIKRDAAAMGNAAQQATFLQAQYDATFDQSIIWMTDSEAAIQNQIKGLKLLGTVQGDVLAKQLRYNSQLKDTKQTVDGFVNTSMSSLSSALSEVFNTKTTDQIKAHNEHLEKMAAEGRNGAIAWIKFSDTIVAALQKMAIELAIIKPLMGALQGGLGSVGSIGASFFGGGTGASVLHAGGIVGQTPAPKRYVHPAYFENAPRLHNGLGRDEFAAILQRGERVIPRGATGSGGGPINITVNNTPAGTSVGRARTSRGANGSVNVDIMLRRIVDDRMVAAAQDPNHPFNHQLGAMGLDRSRGM